MHSRITFLFKEFPQFWSFLSTKNILQLLLPSLSVVSFSSIPFSTMSLISLSFHLLIGLSLMFFLSSFQFITSCGILLIFIRWICPYHGKPFFVYCLCLYVCLDTHSCSYFNISFSFQSWCFCRSSPQVYFCRQ